MSKPKNKGKRLSKQNYCTFCKYREKIDSGTVCMKVGMQINLAMENCDLLQPFNEFKEHKEIKKGVG